MRNVMSKNEVKKCEFLVCEKSVNARPFRINLQFSFNLLRFVWLIYISTVKQRESNKLVSYVI